ncbi:hypothetical protein K450DRAFT_247731 [Umbelopsis ramanniana AG]|uniref:RNI-like protein n=1 Tax=Umbelopsis ramanniana AG TaxID=1314678 RepID=A0AAD5HDB5_UMBRA|nr:uncharacterized protein K450DRAFT_247731 [Umbelopsis ramanniana AG]KAI8578401.1 hypothetical protein K450DRAFT_247731 [Umbelopsis ramanniana AG]
MIYKKQSYFASVTHLEMNSFEKCKEIESDIMELANDQSYAQSLIQPLKTIRDSEATATEFENLHSTDSIRNAQIYLSLARAYLQVSMNKKALKNLDKGFLAIEHDVDAASMALKLDNLVLKGDVTWQIKVGDTNALATPYLDALSLVNSASDHLSTGHILEVKTACMQKLTRIYDYFHVTQESDKWSSELKLLESTSHITNRFGEKYLPSSDEEYDEAAPMPSQKVNSQLSLALGESVADMEINNPESSSMVIEVHVTDINQDWKLLVPWTDKSSTVKWLSHEIANRYWIAFAKLPHFSHLEAGGAVILANDLLAHVLSDSKPIVTATIERYEPKSLEEIYLNICTRHEYPPDNDIKLQLGSSDNDKIFLTGLGIIPHSFKPLALTIGLSESLSILDLSANLLDDSAISTLFATAVNGGHPIMPKLKGINLASNLITATGFTLLVNSLSQSLEALNISFNPLGAGAILSMSKAITKFPNLTSISLDNCDIGDIADNGILFTQPDELNLSKRCCGLSVSIANNPMGRRTEKNLEAVLICVPDLQSLDCSRIASLGLGSLLTCLSSLKSLQLLDVSNTTLGDVGVSGICNLFKQTSYLKSINMNYCGINSGHMDLISAALQENKSLVEMKLSGNKIMDQGMKALMTCSRAGQRLVLDDIHLNDCAITADTVDISRFIRCFKHVDMSNNVIIDSNADFEYLLSAMLEEATSEKVTIDTRLNDTDLDRVSQTRPDLWSRFSVNRHPIRKLQLTIIKRMDT